MSNEQSIFLVSFKSGPNRGLSAAALRGRGEDDGCGGGVEPESGLMRNLSRENADWPNLPVTASAKLGGSLGLHLCRANGHPG